MATEKAPSFQFYPKDFLSDALVSEMSSEARGCYVMLLCHCWLEGSLPNDQVRLRQWAGFTGLQKAWPAVWRKLRPCFALKGRRFIQPRLERERQKQADYREKKQRAGRLGGMKKESNAQEKRKVALLDSASGKRLPKPTLSSSTSVLTSTDNQLIRKISTAASPRNSAAETPTKADNRLQVMVKMAHVSLDNGTSPDDYSSVKEDVKQLCSDAGILYEPELAGKAVDSALTQRKRRRQ